MKFLAIAALMSLAHAHSPVLLWPADEFNLHDQHSALEMMDMKDFEDLFLDKKVIVFHKRTFNLEEVSYPTKALTYLQNVNAVALQGVKSIHRLLASLKSTENLQIVRLDDSDLSEQQDFIKATMEKHPGFAAILVGSGSHRLSRRAAPESFEKCQVRGQNQNCMVYVTGVTKGDGGEATCSLDCPNEGEITITLSGNKENAVLRVQSDADGFYNITTEKPYALDVDSNWAPDSFSWSCSQLNILNKDPKESYTVSGLQLWPKKDQDSFSDSFDCTTWFTTTLWMGFVIVFFYLFILFGAILFLLDVRTNDRFDDPKGKTITVNVAE